MPPGLGSIVYTEVAKWTWPLPYCNEERRHKLGFRTQSFILIMYLAFAVGGAAAPGGFLDGVHLHLVAPKRGLRLSELGHRTEAKHISY